MSALSPIWDQVKQWPPTSSTVVGAGILLGLGSFAVTGSWEAAATMAGIFKVLCPEDAAAVDRAMDVARQVATTPKP